MVPVAIPCGNRPAGRCKAACEKEYIMTLCLSLSRRALHLLFFTVAVFALGRVAFADEPHPKPIPPGGVALLHGDGVTDFSLYKTPSASLQIVNVTGQPFSHALQLTTIKQPTNSWDIQAGAATVAPAKKGDVCLAVFSMRVTHSGSGYGRTNLVMEDATSYNKSLWFEASAGEVWKKFYAPFVVKQDEAAGQAQIRLHIGFLPQTIEVADIHVTDYGNSVKLSDLPQTQYTYEGREANAPWRKAAAARIEKYRKGNLVVKVTDTAGRPVVGATVSVHQTRHAFGFGTALDNVFIRDSPDSKHYRALTYAQYNEAVIGNALKAEPWEKGGTDAYGDPYSQAEALRFVHELRAHQMKVRGHNLVWPSWIYSRVWEPLKSNPPALAAHILSHIKDEVGALKGQCFEWDVVNEPYNNHDIQDILGPHCLVDWYNAAHAADPAARLFINDYDITENNGENAAHINAYDAQIKYLLDNKAPLGGIGLQSHFGRMLTSPEKAYAIMNRFARFGLPLEVTEFDVNVPDEQLQTDYLRDYMTIAFSQPAVSGFVMWGFWEGDHWLPDAALYRKDFSIKPNGLAYQDLVFHQWWTEKKGISGTNGKFATRAFLGDYTVSVSIGGKSVTHTAHVMKNGANTTTVTFILPGH